MQDSEMDRRQYRRKRRIRNQVLAYLLLIILFILVVIPLFMALKKFSGYIKDNAERYPEVVSSNSSNESASENDGLPDTISSPETVSEDIAALQESLSEDDAVEEEPVDEDIRALIDSLSVEEKTAALFMVSPEALTGVDAATKAGDGTKSALEKYAVSGILYDEKNVLNKDQFKEMSLKTDEMYKELYSSDAPLRYLIRGIEDGDGLDALLKASGKDKSKSYKDLGGAEAADTYQDFLSRGSVLNEYDLDLLSAPSCEISDDGFSSDAETAAAFVASAVSGLSDQGVMSMLSVYPEEGDAEGAVFKAGADKGAAFVFTGAGKVLNEAGEEEPAYISEQAVNTLKDGLGFKGVVITDDINKLSEESGISVGEAALRAVNAGADMIYVSGDLESVYTSMLAAVKDGAVTGERLDDCLVRIFTMKKKYM